MLLALERPLAVFDLETTGTDPAKDRIAEISVLRMIIRRAPDRSICLSGQPQTTVQT